MLHVVTTWQSVVSVSMSSAVFRVQYHNRRSENQLFQKISCSRELRRGVCGSCHPIAVALRDSVVPQPSHIKHWRVSKWKNDRDVRTM